MFRDWYEPKPRYPVRCDIKITRGDTYTKSVRVLFKRHAGLLNKTGRVRWLITPESGGDKQILKTYDYRSQRNDGVLTLALYPRDTENLPAGRYVYEVEFDYTRRIVITALKGLLEIYADNIRQEVDHGQTD